MQTLLVLTVIGEDKPGLVESMAQAITDNSGNWLESSLSQIAGKFAGVLVVSVSGKCSSHVCACCVAFCVCRFICVWASAIVDLLG